MSRKRFTVIIIPDGSPKTRRFHLDGKMLVVIEAALVLATFLMGMSIIASSILFSKCGSLTRENRALQDQNSVLTDELKQIKSQVVRISSTLDKVSELDRKLRTVSSLPSPTHSRSETSSAAEQLPNDGTASSRDRLSIPVHDNNSPEAASIGQLCNLRPSETAMPGTETAMPGTETAMPGTKTAIESTFGGLSSRASSQADNLQYFLRYFEARNRELGYAPAEWPTLGQVTSDFGHRLDPFTAERTIHNGLDIAASPGSDVIAPSDGIVVFTGTENGYGKVLIIDHGNEVKTRFAHLSGIDVSVGTRVKRGDKLGEVGTTGRSTGPHLHYEVRVGGAPENPRKFILE